MWEGRQLKQLRHATVFHLHSVGQMAQIMLSSEECPEGTIMGPDGICVECPECEECNGEIENCEICRSVNDETLCFKCSDGYGLLSDDNACVNGRALLGGDYVVSLVMASIVLLIIIIAVIICVLFTLRQRKHEKLDEVQCDEEEETPE